MSFKEELLKLMLKVYRNDEYINSFFDGTQTPINNVDTVIIRLLNLFHFNRLDIKGCEWWEKLLKITDINPILADRQAKIRAKWITKAHNDIDLIQKVCDSWERGEVEADFLSGKIVLRFVGKYGIPDALNSLLKSIDEVKPAHLSLLILFKYLLIKDIHEVKTIEQMEEIPLHMFAF